MVYICKLWGGFGVDIFLILSGFGITFSNMKKAAANSKEKWMEYYKRRITRILPAYLCVAIPFYIVTSRSVGEFFYNLFFLNFIIDGKRDFWYILAIMICYIVFPLVREIRKKTNFIFSLFIAVLTAFLVAVLVQYTSPNLYKNWEIVLWRFPCFWMGCYYGILSFEGKSKEFRNSTVLFTVLGLLFLTLSGFSRNTFTFISPIIMVAICFIAETILTDNYAVMRVTSFLGKVSLELYLVHVSFGILISDYFYKVCQSKPINLSIYICVSVTFAVALHYLLQYPKPNLIYKNQ